MTDQTQRIVVEVIDPSLESPHLKIHYKDWKLSPDQMIDVFLSIKTSWDDRFLHCDIQVNNFEGEIGVGMTGFGDKEAVSLDEDLGLLFGFGPYATGGDQMLQADGRTCRLLVRRGPSRGILRHLRPDETSLAG